MNRRIVFRILAALACPFTRAAIAKETLDEAGAEVVHIFVQRCLRLCNESAGIVCEPILTGKTNDRAFPFREPLPKGDVRRVLISVLSCVQLARPAYRLYVARTLVSKSMSDCIGTLVFQAIGAPLFGDCHFQAWLTKIPPDACVEIWNTMEGIKKTAVLRTSKEKLAELKVIQRRKLSFELIEITIDGAYEFYIRQMSGGDRAEGRSYVELFNLMNFRASTMPDGVTMGGYE